MEIGKKYDVVFETVTTEFNVTLKALPLDTYDGFVFVRDDGKEVWVRDFAKIVEK